MKRRDIEGRRARARDHKLRRALLAMLAGEEAAAPELRAKMAGGPALSVVAYHLAVLLDVGLIDRVGGLYRVAR